MNMPDYWFQYLSTQYTEDIESSIFQEIPESGNRMMVIVETRIDHCIPYVLRNFVLKLAPKGWGLLIFHGQENDAFIHEITRKWKHVHTRNLGLKRLHNYMYNRLLCSPRFWHAIPAEHILIFQLDTFIRKDNIDVFMEYDYVGAPWKPILDIVGNGGLSYRKKSAMLNCLDKVPYIPTCHLNGKDMVFQNEDKYYCLHAAHLLHRPDACIAMKFSVETTYYHDPLGLHKPWDHIEDDLVYNLLVTEER